MITLVIEKKFFYREIVEKSSVKIDIILSYCRHSLWDNEFVNYLDYFKVSNSYIFTHKQKKSLLLLNDLHSRKILES